MFVSRVFVLLIMKRYCTLNSYLSIINKINTHETNSDSSNDYAATSLMFKLSSLFGFQLRKWVGQQSCSQSLRCGGEGSGNEIGGAETSKFGAILLHAYKHSLSVLCFRYYENHRTEIQTNLKV